jgi:rhodanese-related sulfurtransferase
MAVEPGQRGDDQMSFRKWAIAVCVFFLIVKAMASVSGAKAPAQGKPEQPKEIERITVEELKAKLAKNEPVMIIDLRAVDSFINSPSKIKGAVYMKARRLRYRLGFAPFKELPRDREIVTYCACPSDEIAVRAAQVLLDAGFKRVRALKGGWQAWLKAGGQVESKPRV